MNDVSFMISGDAMKIITCYKCVPDEQDIAVNNADGSLDFSKADAKISQYDLNAIEAACQLKQQAAEAQVTALSVGGKALTNAKGRKDVLSRGPDELIVVIDDQFEQALPQQTASALAAAAQKAGFDLILCGDGSSDLYAQQTNLLGIKVGRTIATEDQIKACFLGGCSQCARRLLRQCLLELVINHHNQFIRAAR